MFLSVIIPMYNMEKYIAGCLDGLSRQTYKDFEIIIVDDGSKDKSYDVALEYLKNSNIQYKILRKSNQGQSIARNIGILNAKGDYVFFLDCDDSVSEDFVSTCSDEVDKYSPDILLFDYKRVREDGSVIREHNKKEIPKDKIAGITALKMYKNNKLKLWTSNAIYRRQFLRLKQIIFFTEGYAAEDLGFQFKALLSTDNVRVIRDTLSNYFQRNDSLSNKVDINKNISVIDSFEDVLKFIEEKEMNISLEKSILKEFIPEHIMYQILTYLNKDNAEEVVDILLDKRVNRYLKKASIITSRYGKSMVKWMKMAAWSPEKFVVKYLEASAKN